MWEAELPTHQDIYIRNIPRRVFGKRNNKIEVLTGQGVIYLTRLQFSDEAEKSAADIFVSVNRP